MCLIVRGKVSALATLDLGLAEEFNSDGFGVHFGESVLYSFDFPKKRIFDVLGMLPVDAVATIHFRYATHGNKDKANCHPFALGDGTYLMHNGVLRGAPYQDPAKVKSDTAMLADSLSRMRGASRNLLLDALSTGNRFCLLRGNKWKRFGNWEYDKATDTWHSNNSILPRKASWDWAKSDRKSEVARACNPLLPQRDPYFDDMRGCSAGLDDWGGSHSLTWDDDQDAEYEQWRRGILAKKSTKKSSKR